MIELMITVVVIGVLAAIALPSYRNYITRGNIPEATSGLFEMRSRAEQYFADNRTYVNFTCTAPAQVKNFTFSCPTLTATGYLIQAVGNASGNMADFTYSINQMGTRVADTPWGDSGTCWIINQGGGC